MTNYEYAGKSFNELNEKEMSEIIGGTEGPVPRGTPSVVLSWITKAAGSFVISWVASAAVNCTK